MTIQRANGKELSGLSSRDYPGARALINHAKVPKLPMRPTVLEAKDDLPETTTDGCIGDFDDVDVINCTYGDESATRTIALAGRFARRTLDHRARPARPACTTSRSSRT